MHQKQDSDHLKAMEKMKALMQNPEEMKQWMDSKRQEFNSLPDN